MQRTVFCGFALVMVGLALSALGSGCGGNKEKPKNTPNDVPKPPEAKLTPIKGGDGTIKGKIVFVGDMPKSDEELISKRPECISECRLDKKLWKNENSSNQEWILGADKGVANVFVSLKVPEGKFFDPAKEDKENKDDVAIRQPCCAYLPHITFLFAGYRDEDKKLHRSGHKLVIYNDAEFGHNSKVTGNPEFDNPEKGGNLAPKTGKNDKIELNPQPTPVSISCDVHTWMKGKIWVLDHPYGVVTKEDGTFELKRVPVDTKLTVQFWHEARGVFETKEVTVGAGKTEPLEIKISAK